MSILSYSCFPDDDRVQECISLLCGQCQHRIRALVQDDVDYNKQLDEVLESIKRDYVSHQDKHHGEEKSRVPVHGGTAQQPLMNCGVCQHKFEILVRNSKMTLRKIVHRQVEMALYQGKDYYPGLVASPHLSFSNDDDYGGPGDSEATAAECVLKLDDFHRWQTKLEAGLVMEATYRFYEYLKTAKVEHDALFSNV